MFRDSCSGQNKNYFVLFGIKEFCKKYEIDFEWYFLVQGHSFMTADYDSFIQQVGNLFIVGKDLQVADHKAMSSTLLKVLYLSAIVNLN